MRMLSRLAPAGTIVLALIFLYANPYQTPGTPPLAASTIRIVYLALVLPAVAAAVAYFLQSRVLKWPSGRTKNRAPERPVFLYVRVGSPWAY